MTKETYNLLESYMLSSSVRQHCVQRLRDLPLVDQRPGNADGTGHVHLVRVEQAAEAFYSSMLQEVSETQQKGAAMLRAYVE